MGRRFYSKQFLTNPDLNILKGKCRLKQEILKGRKLYIKQTSLPLSIKNSKA